VTSFKEGFELLFEELSFFGVFFDEVCFFGGVFSEVVELEFRNFDVGEGFGDDGVAGGVFGVLYEFPVARAVAEVSFRRGH